MRAVEKRLREQIRELERELSDVRRDRELLRGHFASRFRWWIELLGKQTSPNLPWLIESDAKYLRSFQAWPW